MLNEPNGPPRTYAVGSATAAVGGDPVPVARVAELAEQDPSTLSLATFTEWMNDR